MQALTPAGVVLASSLQRMATVAETLTSARLVGVSVGDAPTPRAPLSACASQATASKAINVLTLTSAVAKTQGEIPFKVQIKTLQRV